MSRKTLTASLEAAISSRSQGDRQRYTWSIGKAAGIVLATELRGIESSVMFDKISDAFENGNADALEELRLSVVRLDGDSRVDDSQDGPTEPGTPRRYPSWDEYGSALNEAIEARKASDRVRYSLMVGLVSGMMHRDPGPQYTDGTILAKITRGYETDSAELLQEAQRHIMSGVRMTAPVFAVSDEAIEERMNMMRRVQNFGLRIARGEDESVKVPTSTRINLALLRGAREDEDERA